jgi:hypothetical protein
MHTPGYLFHQLNDFRPTVGISQFSAGLRHLIQTITVVGEFHQETGQLLTGCLALFQGHSCPLLNKSPSIHSLMIVGGMGQRNENRGPSSRCDLSH